MKFYNLNMAQISNIRVNEQTRKELEGVLRQIKIAASKLGEFQDENPDLDLVSAGSHRCPHCGSALQSVGWETCPSCGKTIAWASTPPLRYAGTRLPTGHVYASTISGACKPEDIDRLSAYYKLRSVTANLERDFVIKKLANEKKKSNCFVATACFDNEDHPTVAALRNFRDESLACSTSGKAFIAWYYRNGPTLAKFVKAVPIVRIPLRLILTGFVRIIRSARK